MNNFGLLRSIGKINKSGKEAGIIYVKVRFRRRALFVLSWGNIPPVWETKEFMMKIWVDADACPGVIKEILFRAAKRTGITVTLVANHYLQTPKLRQIKFLKVPPGFDVADDEIVKRVEAGDLVITADIPLAAEVIEKGAQALNPRGERYSSENIRSLLSMRDFMDTMRSSGVDTGGGPAPLNLTDRQAFANQLDRFLSAYPNN